MQLTAYWKSMSVGRRTTELHKTFLMIKLTILLLVAACLHVSAHSFGQTVTYSKKQASLEEIFEAIHQQTGYFFYYQASALKHTNPVTLQVKNAPLTDVLQRCFAGQPLQYEITKDVIIVTGKPIKPSVDTSWLDVRGRVINAAGDGIAGATITVLSIERMTSTDESGRFILPRIPRSSLLEVSSVGFQTRKLALSGATELEIRMEVADTKLDEVQVVAYGTQTRRFNTGNVSKVSGKEIELQPISNPLSAMQGRVAGLSIQQNTGVPGGGFTVRLRGQNSIRANGNDLYYIVDGVPFPSRSIANPGTSFVVSGGNPLNLINPADIESIEVLKDADATAIYGSLGANGVVLITTKKGKAGKTEFGLNYHQGWGKVASRMNMLSRRQYLDMRMEAFKNDVANPSPFTYDITQWDTTRYTDWQKTLVGGTAGITNVDASLSGGNERTQFLLSGTFRQEGTVFPGDFQDKKGGFHFNLNHRSADQRFKVGVTTNYVSDRNNLIYTDLMGLALELAPVAPAIYLPNGELNWENSTWYNPLGYIRQSYLGLSTNLISNLNLSFDLTKNWQFKLSGGYSEMRIRESNLQPSSSFDPAWGVLGFSSFSTARQATWILEPQIHYKQAFGKINAGLLVGATLQETKREGERINANNFANDAVLNNPMAAGTITISDVIDNRYRYVAQFARVSLDWDKRYLVNLTGRRDGSSRFGPGKQFGTFGSAGAAWVFNREKWFNSKVISFSKLRISYGITGNDQIGDYGYLQLWNYATNNYDGSPVIQPANLANADFRWESNRKLEAGVEMGFLSDKLFLAISYYNNRSGNQLVGYTLPVITGFSNVQYNLNAIVENAGWEFEWSSTNLEKKTFQWRTSANLSLPRNRLIDFPNISSSSYGRSYIIGQPIMIQRSYQSTGLNQVTGVYEFSDVDKDGRISYPNDAVVPRPMFAKALFGLSNTLEWKGWQIDLFFQGANQTGYNFRRFLNMPGLAFNQPTYVLDRWQQEGDRSTVQRFSQSTGSEAARSYNLMRTYGDEVISDASYVRLKNAAITYNLPSSLINRMRLQRCQVYLQGQNLLTFTNYKGLDPETMSFRNIPPLRVVAVGARLTF